MSTESDISVTVSSGNVFADLEVAEPDEMLAKAELARTIGTIIAGQHLTQAQAAGLLGIDQPKVSALVHGRLAGFSLDRLLHFLLVLNRDVEIVVRPASHLPLRGHVSVVSLA